MDLISVIIPVFKVEKYLDDCISSVVNQTFSNLEIILIDDGSPDNCPQICDDWAKKDSRIKVIHKENGGLSSARNAGIDIATGNYLTFVDSDDIIDTQMVSTLFEAIQTNKTDISSCSYLEFTDEVHSVNKNSSFSLLTPERFWMKDTINATIAWGKLYSYKLFDDIRYPLGKLHEDEFTTYKLLFKCSKISFTEAKLYFYRRNYSGITKSDWNPKRMDIFEAYNEQIVFFKEIESKDCEFQSKKGQFSSALKQIIEIRRSKEVLNIYSKEYGYCKSILKDIIKSFNNDEKKRLISFYLKKYMSRFKNDT